MEQEGHEVYEDMKENIPAFLPSWPFVVKISGSWQILAVAVSPYSAGFSTPRILETACPGRQQRRNKWLQEWLCFWP